LKCSDRVADEDEDEDKKKPILRSAFLIELKMERLTRFELATFCMASRRSTN
jgi:hypothetical protein